MSLVFDKQTNAIDICRAFAGEIKGRTVVLTGPTPGGVGYTVALDIAEQGPALMVLVGRTLSKLAEARDGVVAKNPAVKVELVQCDLGSLASVRKAAGEIIAKDYTIDYFIASAAIMDAPFTITDEGFELQLVTNYLSNYVLLGGILPQILRSEKKTVVLVSSGSHALNSVKWEDPYFSHTDYGTQKGYAQSKSAVILYARALAKQYGGQGLRVLSPTPGPTPSNLARHWTTETKVAMGKRYHGAFHEDGELNLASPLWKTLEQGAATIVRAAFDRSLPNGVYMNDCNVAEATCAEWAKDPALVDRIQAWTDGLIKGSIEAK